MRPLWKDILAAVWIGILIPGIVLHAAVLVQRNRIPATALTVQPQVPLEPEILLRQEDGTVLSVARTAYLTGVLLAEMPTSFHSEALKAQSVAARTYAAKAVLTGGKHGDGSICVSPGCCQAYMTESEFFSRGGTPEALEKVRLAVKDTEPYVLEYDGELIEAVYFSSSGGYTEAAVEVWGADFPYLQSVESPGEENASYHRDSSVFSAEEFQQLLEVSLPEDPESWFGSPEYTEGGGVARMEIGGKIFTGLQLRATLGLRSTAFSMDAAGDTVTVTTAGYGHRVGLSQYGANAMAESGSSWQAILSHYYPGTEPVPLS